MAPSRRQCRAAGTVINCATSVRCDYYFRFAVWLFAQGRDVLVYDYRGIGGSRRRSKRARTGSTGAARLRAAHATRFRASRSTSSRTASAGSRSGRRIERPRAVTVGAQYAYWRDYRPAERRRMWWKWHVVMPVLAAVFGSMPAKRLDGRYAARRLSWVRSQALRGELYERPARRTHRAAPRPPFADCRRRCSRLASTTTGSARSRRSSGWSATTRAATSRICGSRRPTSASTRSAIRVFHCRFTETLWPLALYWLQHGALPADAPGYVHAIHPASRGRGPGSGVPGVARTGDRAASSCGTCRGRAPALGIDAGGPQRFAISPDRLTSDVSFHRPPHVDARFRFPSESPAPGAAARRAGRRGPRRRADRARRFRLARAAASPAYAALSDGARARAHASRHEDAVRARRAARRARHGPRHRAAGGGDRRRCIGSAVAGRRASRVARLQRVACGRSCVDCVGASGRRYRAATARPTGALTREVCAPAESAYLDSLPPAEARHSCASGVRRRRCSNARHGHRRRAERVRGHAAAMARPRDDDRRAGRARRRRRDVRCGVARRGARLCGVRCVDACVSRGQRAALIRARVVRAA